MPITDLNDEHPERYQTTFQMDLGDDVIVGVFVVNLEPGTSGVSEANLDEAVQGLVDHLATLPNLATGSLSTIKSNRHNFTVTPTEEE